MKNLLATLALTALALPAAGASPPRGDYQSTTAAFTPYRETAIADWRAANDEMARLNGHMGHMGGQGDQPMQHPMHHHMDHGMPPAQPAPEGMAGHQHHTGGKP